jgi:hypothetical protein
MRKYLIVVLIATACFASAQINLNTVTNTINSALGGGLSNEDVIKGVREALKVGSQNAGDKASKLDGFYKNNLIKIPFPKEATQMKTTLVQLGMKTQVDAFEKQLNRAAEDAAKKAAPIFVNAVTKMTINDGLSILRGKDDEATQFLKKSTSTELSTQFKPIIKTSLQKVQITKYWNPLFSKYNKIPFVNKVNPNLDEYVTEKAIEGMFKLVAEEELKIRKDPSARVSDILKKVFAKK